MKAFTIISLSFLATACAHQPKQVTYLEAAEMPQIPAPQIIEVPTPMPVPGQLKALPTHTEKPKKSDKPWRVIDKANQTAQQKPEQDGYFNAMMQFDYAPGALYQVYAAPLKLTDIQLQPGEKILGNPAAGDTTRWVLGIGHSKQQGKDQQHVYIKPTKPGLHTTLSINTDKRTYHIELHSYQETYMAAVNWRYPHEELNTLQLQTLQQTDQNQQITSTDVQLDQINFDYQIKIKDGDPNWTPNQVFDDGRKTFIRFPNHVRYFEAPVLFVLSEENDMQLVNYRVKNDFYVVDRLFQKAELRLGQDDPAIVQIIKQD